MKDSLIQFIEAIVVAGMAAAGAALVAGIKDWRLILGAALVAGAAKALPSRIV